MDQKHAPLTHLGYLDGIRAVAALYVVLHHASIQTPLPFATVPYVGRVALRLLGYGHYAVDLFIVLSGFCLMLPAARGNGTIRHSVFEFLRRRAIRIIPPYYFALALSLLLIHFMMSHATGTIWDSCLPVTGKGLLTHLLLVQDLFGEAHTVDYPAWSISVEWRIYFLFPFLVWLWWRMGPILTTCVTVVCSYLVASFCDRYFHDGYSTHYLGLFVMGMFGADVAFSPRLEKLKGFYWGTVALISIPTILFVSTANVFHGQRLPLEFIDYVVGLGSMALLIILSTGSSHLMNRLFNYRPLVFVGSFAYSIYLIHAPLLQVMWQSLVMFQSHQWWMFAVQTVIGIPLIVGLSYLFFLCCERPFLLGKSKKMGSVVAETALAPAP